MTYLIEVSTEVKFQKWYVAPIDVLRKMDHGDGGIAALIIAFPLYERYLTKLTGSDSSKRADAVRADLGLDDEHQARLFWNVFRDGLCHMATFWEESDRSVDKGWVLPKVGIDDDYPLPRFVDSGGETTIRASAWGLVDHILKKYSDDPSLITHVTAPLLPLYCSVTHEIRERNICYP